MTISNTARKLNSVVEGAIFNDGPSRVDAVRLDYTVNPTVLEAHPGVACTFTGDNTVAPGGTGVFAGILLANQRVLSDKGQEYFLKGDAAEVMQMGSVSVEIAVDDSVAIVVGGPVWFAKASGELKSAQSSSGSLNTKIAGAVIKHVGATANGKAWAVITLNGPQA